MKKTYVFDAHPANKLPECGTVKVTLSDEEMDALVKLYGNDKNPLTRKDIAMFILAVIACYVITSGVFWLIKLIWGILF